MQVDVFHLPSRKRVHKCIGAGCFERKTGVAQRRGYLCKLTASTGTVMALSLYKSDTSDSLKCLIGYEDGGVALFQHTPHDTPNAAWSHAYLADNESWNKIWEAKLHKEPSGRPCYSRICAV